MSGERLCLVLGCCCFLFACCERQLWLCSPSGAFVRLTLDVPKRVAHSIDYVYLRSSVR